MTVEETIEAAPRPEWPLIAGAASLAVAIRIVLAFLPLNEAEYTDGILQLTLFTRGNPYWPPLYSILSVSLGLLLNDLELGGRLVSAVLGGLALIPLALIAHRLGGRKAAKMAMLLFLVMPEPLRWGIRVMTDATFLTLLATAVWLLMPSRHQLFLPAQRLVLGSLVSVLAALTRYQGMLMLFPIAWAILERFRHRQTIGASVAAQALWLAIPAWVLRGGFAHLQQMADRSGADLGLTMGQTLLAYWNLVESYIYLFPYSVTFGVFSVFLAGLFLRTLWFTRPGRWFLGMFLLSTLLILGTQAPFGVFDFRYMMPLLVFVIPYAGVGLQRIDEALARTRIGAVVVFSVVLIPPTVLSIASLVLQREAFGDIKAAALYASSIAAPDARFFSNEFYNAKIPVVKTDFWADRPVAFDPEFTRFVQTRMAPLEYHEPLPPQLRLRPGDIILFSTIYANPQTGELAYKAYLGQYYDYETIGRFNSVLTPVLTDVMGTPHTHHSPVSWFYRYSNQASETIVIRIKGVHDS